MLRILLLITALESYGSKFVLGEKAQKEKIFDQLIYPAVVTTPVQVSIRSEIKGQILKKYIHLGQKVSIDGPLFKIKNTDTLSQYHNQIVKSPIKGIVSKVYSPEGAIVFPNDPLVQVIDPTRVRILIEVPISNLKYLKVKNKGTLNLHEKTYSVVIQGISPIIDMATGTSTVEFSLSKNPTQLLGGLGTIRLKLNDHQGILLPDSAIYYQDNEIFVRKVVKGKMKKSLVELGKKRQGNVEILKGVQEGDFVITRSSEYLKEGEAVKIQK